jgi:hypothetical protein
MDLYRVGVPSIGEVYKERFNFGRGSGGIGTGVYAFREEWAANSNIEDTSPDRELYVLEDILESPIQPTTRDAVFALHDLSTYMDYLSVTDDMGTFTFDDALEEGDTLRAAKPGGFSEPGFDGGKLLSSLASTFLLHTPQLRPNYGYDNAALLRDFIEATREATRMADAADQATGVQPVNVLLYPDHDGVAPLAGAGGNTGTWGCVVFKQVVDEIVGRETTSFEKVPELV